MFVGCTPPRREPSDLQELAKRLFTLLRVVAAEGSLIEDLPQRQQGDILDLRFKIVDLNESDLRKSRNPQSTI